MISRIVLFVLVSVSLLAIVIADGRAIEVFDSSNSPRGSAPTTSDYSAVPNLEPLYDWSKSYVSLFKQAIKEKYNVSDETMDEKLRVISVVSGEEVDGPDIPFTSENLGKIHYLYQIDWAVYNGHLKFKIKDSTSNELNDQQILEDMKSDIPQIFIIEKIISKEKATDLGGVFPNLEWPFYSNDNNIEIESSYNKPSYNKLVFNIYKTLSSSENRCLKEVFSLETGERFYSEERACVINALGNTPRMPVAVSSPYTSWIIVATILLAIIISLVILIKKRKIARR